MKKGVKIFGLMFLSLILLSSFVIAADAGVGGMVESLGKIVESIYQKGVEPLAKFMIGTESAYDPALFFSLIVILVLLVSVIWEITDRIPVIGNNNWVQFIVSFGISLISVRFLGASANSGWLEVVLLPNQALGIALMSMIPLVVYFFFVLDVGEKSKTLAKILWIFAAILFAVLYLIRADTLSGAGSFNPATVYLLAAVASIALLFFDGTIRRLRKKIIIEESGRKTIHAAELEIRRKIVQANIDLRDLVIDPKEHESIIKNLRSRLKYLMKQ